MSPRGTFAFIGLIGSLNKFLAGKKIVSYSTTPKERFSFIEKYLTVLLDYINKISKEEETTQLTLLGSGADIKWLRFFQTIINSKFRDYEPLELVDWKERQDEQLQDEGRKYGVAIEKKMKKIVIEKIKILYKKNWELEINSIKRECQDRAEKEMEKNYKEGLKDEVIPWTEMFNINDYKSIIEKYWTKVPDNEQEKIGFSTFQDDFSINIGAGFNSKGERIKWISLFSVCL